jgi:hypothetical protein
MFQNKSEHGGISAGGMTKRFFSFWMRKYKIVFFIIFFGICAWSGFLWYYSLYYFQWSLDQKQAYIDSQSHKTALNMNDFENVLKILDNRNSIYREEKPPAKTIFGIVSSEKK